MKNVALVISSGGARGLAAIGIIEELEKQGYKITSISGCSIGSLIGGMYASGNLSKFTDWVVQLDKKDVFRLMDFTINHQGILKGDKIFNEIKTIFQDIEIENLKTPYSAVAVDLISHKEHVFRSGSLFNAIRASCAIPSIVKPVKLNNKVLVDGGIINPLPLSHVERIDGDILMGIDLNSFEPNHDKTEKSYLIDYDKYIRSLSSYLPINIDNFSLTKNGQVGSFFDIAGRTFQIMQDKIIQDSIEKHKPNLVIKVPRSSSSMFDFFKANELISLGRSLFLDQIK
ncbi:MAG: hypothetical protein CMP65_01575 [Flavobacteriales bacterium]|nr:hypothetical protein [Flavobacteriales bacterium]|tara:strand:+ start:1872 stop:2729 length:858 start_codon:yes stop_codon:yes gene_type:complete